jgi:hypothetical protein
MIVYPNELPLYRKITAPLQIDAGTLHGFITGQMIWTFRTSRGT